MHNTFCNLQTKVLSTWHQMLEFKQLLKTKELCLLDSQMKFYYIGGKITSVGKTAGKTKQFWVMQVGTQRKVCTKQLVAQPNLVTATNLPKRVLNTPWKCAPCAKKKLVAALSHFSQERTFPKVQGAWLVAMEEREMVSELEGSTDSVRSDWHWVIK